MRVFYSIEDIPVHSVLLLPTRKEAMAYPKDRIALGFCRSCGFIRNTAFDARLLHYSHRYEKNQVFSGTFKTFQRNVVMHLIQRYALHGKKVLEIGFGKSEFLRLLCELGGNQEIGIDPSYVPTRYAVPTRVSVEFVNDFYSEKYAGSDADFMCCVMTLEHISAVSDFLRKVRLSIGHRHTLVFFQVRDASRILKELAFWDIYYDRCSYFSAGSLGGLFRTCGFELLDLYRSYGDQYLMIEACPSGAPFHSVSRLEERPEDLTEDVARFSFDVLKKILLWRRYLNRLSSKGRRVVLWGAGSKAVAFLTTLKIVREVQYVVDTNASKQGTFIAGTGQQVVGPDFLRSYKPDVVIAMNRLYLKEVRKDLDQAGLSPRLLALDAPRAAGKTGLA